MPLYRIEVAYDGTHYQGWQVQPHGDTIQGKLEQALASMAHRPVRVVGAGRTDAGVHAHAQVAHFRLDKPIPLPGLLRGLNALLPSDIRARDVELAPPGFHACYGARSKTYRYYLDPSPVASPFRARFTYHYPHPLDLDAMQGAAAAFLGRRDFAAFCASASEAKTTERECTRSRLSEEGRELVYEIAANGFLHHMVRNLVGTLLEVGRGRLPSEAMESLFALRDRRRAGPTAPAHGLHLIRVEY